MDLNGDGFIEQNELQEHINFMQKRYVNNDVERTWKNYKDDQIKDGKLGWKDYRYESLDEHFDQTRHNFCKRNILRNLAVYFYWFHAQF